jgi:hypothetical protein
MPALSNLRRDGIIAVLRVVVVSCGLIGASAAHADLLSFCLGTAPAAQWQLDIYNNQCPAYLQSQLGSAAATTQSSAVTTALAQQQTQAAILTSYAALIKPPPSSVASGVSIEALGIAALFKDAEITRKLATTIGSKVASQLSANNNALLVTATDRVTLLSMPVDSATVIDTMNAYAGRVKSLTCPKPLKPDARVQAIDGGAIGAVLATGALLSAIANVVSAFQPSLTAAAATKVVGDPQQLMAIGLLEGMPVDKKTYLRIFPPAVTKDNKVLKALSALRDEVVAADQRIASCVSHPAMKESIALLSDVNAFIVAVAKTDGTKASLLDLAARRSALDDANIKYTLVLSRDVAGGGIAAVKPNWFSSERLLLAAGDGITYQLVDFDGKVLLAGYESDHWADTCDLDKWSSAFDRCSKAVGKDARAE